jgi:hypothetical protein
MDNSLSRNKKGIAIRNLIFLLAFARQGVFGAPDLPETKLVWPPEIRPPGITELERHTPPRHQTPPIVNCSDCSISQRHWTSSIRELKTSAYYCGFDYLELRFTRHFTSDTLAGILTVYARSLSNDALVVDSATTVFRTPGSENQTVTVYRHEPQHPCYLPLPSPLTVPPDPNGKIEAVARRANSFTALCRFRDRDHLDSWAFSLNGNTWLLEKGRLIHKDTAPPEDRSFSGLIEYRLATWGATPRYRSSFTAEHSVPPEFMAVDIGDSISICRIRIRSASRYGLQHCLIAYGNHTDTIRFSGEHQRESDIIINARPDDTLLSLTLSDIHGNTTVRREALFDERRERQKQWAQRRTLDLLSQERAKQNPVTYAAYMLSKFSEEPKFDLKRGSGGEFIPSVKINPVSTILKTIFRINSERYLAAIGDTTLPDPSDAPVTFPLQGTVSNNLFQQGTGSYQPAFYADRCIFNGTRASLLTNPTLTRTTAGQTFCRFNQSAPLHAGRYPSKWSIDTAPSILLPVSESMALVCTRTEISNGTIILHDLPCILKRPSQSAEFSLLHTTRETTGSDTLTVTYRICYTDRTTDLIWNRFGISALNVTTVPSPENGTITARPHCAATSAGEECFILDVRVSGSKPIFRVDTFVHSQRKNQVVGWGVASLPG